MLAWLQRLLIPLFLLAPLYGEEGFVLGLGSPCIDYVIPVQEEDLTRLYIQKKKYQEIDKGRLAELIDRFQEKMIFTGDCTSNTIKGLAALGVPCALTGRVGNDSLGERIKNDFSQLKVSTLFSAAEITSQVICLITPDGERTFCAYVQPEHEITASDLKKEHFAGAKLIHMEGYLLRNGNYVERGMQFAKEAGAKISIDLANAQLIEPYRERI